jgi:hypothetical protein
MGLDSNRCLSPESDMASHPAFPDDTMTAAAAGPSRPTRPLSAPPTRATATDAPAARFDATSHDGLRHALRAVETAGWDSPAGRAVVEAIRQRAGSWAFLVDRRCGRRAGSTDPADVVSVAWLTVARFACRIADSQHPWAYLWTSVGNELARSAIAESQLTDPARVRGTSAAPTAIVRVGLESALLDSAANGELPERAGHPSGVPHSAAVTEIAGRIAEEPSDVEFWLDAIERALEVMADARRSYEEHLLRRDPYLRETLGLAPAVLSALGALLIGPRKGDRAAQSLLLALHRDIDVPTEAVVGAAARIEVLRAARRVAAAGRSAA